MSWTYRRPADYRQRRLLAPPLATEPAPPPDPPDTGLTETGLAVFEFATVTLTEIGQVVIGTITEIGEIVFGLAAPAAPSLPPQRLSKGVGV